MSTSIDSTAPNPILRQDGTQAPASPAGKHRRCGPAWVPWRWTAGLGGLNPQAPIIIDVCGVEVTVTLASHTADPYESARALSQLRATVSAQLARPQPASGRVISPALPPQVATARWNTPDGDVVLVHPDARRNGFRGRFLGIASAVAVVPLWAHKFGAGVSGLGVAAVASAGVVAVAGISVLADPSDPLLHLRRPAATAPAAIHQSSPVQPHSLTSGTPRAATPQPSAAPAGAQPPTAGPATTPPGGGSPSATPSDVTPSPDPAPATPAATGNAPGQTKAPKPAKSPQPTKSAKPGKPPKTSKPPKTPKPHPGKGQKPAPEPSPSSQ